MERVQNELKRETSPTEDNRIDELLTNMNNFTKVGLPTANGVKFVKVEDIVRCEADGPYTQVFMNNCERLVVSKNLKIYEELLADNKFLRVHKSHLININYIDKYINGDGGSVVMSDGSTVEVSRRKKDELLAMMK